MPTKLTPARLKSAKPSAQPYELADTEVPGLLLRTQPSGHQSFIVTWKRGRRLTIGNARVMTIEQARVKARAILNDAAEHGEPRVIETKRAATFGEFFRDHYTPYAQQHQKDAKGNLAAIKAQFESLFNMPLKQISAFALERYRLKALKAGVKAKTVNRHMDRIRAVLSRAVEWKHLPAHPLTELKDLKVDKAGIVRYLSEDEEARLRKALAERDAEMRRGRDSANVWREARGYPLYPEICDFGDWLTPLVLVAINTGCRRGELLRHLLWSDIDFDRAMLTVRGSHAKSGQTRHIPLNSEAIAVLKRWKTARADAGEIVFPVTRVDRAYQAVLARAKVSKFRLHDCRHHFASKLVMAGVDLNTVRELLGHADISMTLRYAHLAPHHKAAAVAKLVA